MEKEKRRRIEIGENVYLGLERQARWLGISVHALATMILSESIWPEVGGTEAPRPARIREVKEQA